MDTILNDRQRFFEFFKVKYKLFHQSNIFFRDLQFAVLYFHKSLGKKISYSESEKVAHAFANLMVKENIFKKTSPHGFTINLPEYITTTPGLPAN